MQTGRLAQDRTWEEKISVKTLSRKEEEVMVRLQSGTVWPAGRAETEQCGRGGGREKMRELCVLAGRSFQAAF